MSLSQVLPVFNADSWCKGHCFLIVSERELDLAVLAELTGSEEVIRGLLQSVFFFGISCIYHRHALSILQLDCFLS